MFQEEQNSAVDIHATLTCPECETAQKVIMPTNQLQHYYKCINEECMADLAPLPGTDCVFCSYADKPCPIKQLNPEYDKHKLQSLL